MVPVVKFPLILNYQVKPLLMVGGFGILAIDMQERQDSQCFRTKDSERMISKVTRGLIREKECRNGGKYSITWNED
jgi:hypothetical protein